MRQSTDNPISEDVVMRHTLTNEDGECFTISETTLLENCLLLGIFDLNDETKTVLYGRIFKAHIERAKRLLKALDWLAADKSSEAAKMEYGEARRRLEVDCIYYKFSN